MGDIYLYKSWLLLTSLFIYLSYHYWCHYYANVDQKYILLDVERIVKRQKLLIDIVWNSISYELIYILLSL